MSFMWVQMVTHTGFEKYPKLYGSKAWRYLRMQIKDRDGWLCQICLKAGKEKMVSSRDPVDHIKPHNGDRGLFFDENNLQTICTACHNSAKQIQENRGLLPGCDVNGFPLDENHWWLK